MSQKIRITATLGFVLITTFAAPAFGQSFVGEWTATATTPGGDVAETISVVKTADGYVITAKLVGAPEGAPEAGPGTDIVLDGDNFSYKRTLGIPGGELVFTYTGVVSGDTFTGKASTSFGDVPYNGVRIKDGG
jgi:hypothetical protein